MRVGSTNISPNIGYSGRKEPWRIAVHTASNVSSIPLHNTQIAELQGRQNKNLIRGISQDLPERIYNPITAMGFSVMFTFQLDNTKR